MKTQLVFLFVLVTAILATADVKKGVKVISKGHHYHGIHHYRHNYGYGYRYKSRGKCYRPRHHRKVIIIKKIIKHCRHGCGKGYGKKRIIIKKIITRGKNYGYYGKGYRNRYGIRYGNYYGKGYTHRHRWGRHGIYKSHKRFYRRHHYGKY